MSLSRIGHGVHPLMDGEFFQQVMDVVFGRLGLDIQAPRDLLIAQAFGEQLDHLKLSGC